MGNGLVFFDNVPLYVVLTIVYEPLLPIPLFVLVFTSDYITSALFIAMMLLMFSTLATATDIVRSYNRKLKLSVKADQNFIVAYIRWHARLCRLITLLDTHYQYLMAILFVGFPPVTTLILYSLIRSNDSIVRGLYLHMPTLLFLLLFCGAISYPVSALYDEVRDFDLKYC